MPSVFIDGLSWQMPTSGTHAALPVLGKLVPEVVAGVENLRVTPAQVEPIPRPSLLIASPQVTEKITVRINDLFPRVEQGGEMYHRTNKVCQVVAQRLGEAITSWAHGHRMPKAWVEVIVSTNPGGGYGYWCGDRPDDS